MQSHPSLQTPVSLSEGLDWQQIFKSSIKGLVVSVVIGALLGLLVSQVIRPRWTARSTIKIGEVLNKPIEAQADIIARYKLESVRRYFIKQLGLPAEKSDDPRVAVIFESFKVLPKGTHLIEAKVSAYSSEEASAILANFFKVLMEDHQKRFDVLLSDAKINLVHTQEMLTKTKQDYGRLVKPVVFGTSDNQGGSRSQKQGFLENGFSDVLVTNIGVSMHSQIFTLEQQVAQFERNLNAVFTYPTRLLGDIYVSIKSDIPGVPTFVLLGAVVGLLLAGGVLVLRKL